MPRVTRLDTSPVELSPPRTLPAGFLRVDALLARPGVLRYLREDGSERLEYRPPDEHRRAEMLDSLENAPVTVGHPSEGFVSTENADRLVAGSVGRPSVVDGTSHVRATLTLTHRRAIAAVNDGVRELSLGYTVDLEETPGVSPEGERYDAVQRNVIVNHLALVRAGRAGPTCRLRADSLDILTAVESPTGEPPMPKMKLDGVEVEVPQAVADAFTTATKKLEEATAKADAAAARVVALEKDLAELPARLEAQAKEHAEVLTVAAKANVKADGLDTRALRVAVAEAVTTVKCDGKSDEYVAALYAAAKAQLLAAVKSAPTAPVAPAAKADAVDPVDVARREYHARMAKAHLAVADSKE